MTGERVDFWAAIDAFYDLDADTRKALFDEFYYEDRSIGRDAMLGTIHTLRAQVAALAVVMDALGEESINCDNLHHGPKDYHAAFSEPCPVQARVKAALDAARGGEG